MRLAEVIAALPDSVAGITTVLIVNGVWGIPNDATRCPLARFLSGEIGEPVRVALGYAQAVSDVNLVMLPDAVGTFVHQFDNGTLPRKERLLA